MGDFLRCLLYGAVSGFSQFTPVSASAHQVLFPMLIKSERYLPLLSLFIHGGALGALLMLHWQRINHLYREMRLVSLPPKRRKRPPDVNAVLDGKILVTAAIPTLVGAFLSALLTKWTTNLFSISLMLVASGVAIYLPDYLVGGNRKTRSMLPIEGLLLGICAGCSSIVGLSAMALMLALGLLRKFDRSYILDICLLIVGVMLGGQMVVDLVRFVFSGFSGLSFGYLLTCLFAAAAAFGGGIGAILTMRFLSVKTGFSSFAFYNWALGLFTFILYLIL